MKKLILLIVVLLPTWLFAQVDYLEEKNRVSSIKKDVSYIYGEGIGNSLEDATAVAKDFLLSEIRRVIQENISMVDASSINVVDVLDNACIVQFKRGMMDRVFLYIKKDNISVESRPCQDNMIASQTDYVVPVEEAFVFEDYSSDFESVPVEVVYGVEEAAIEEGEYFETAVMDVIEEEVIEEEFYAVEASDSWLSRFVKAPDTETLIALLKLAKEEHKVMWGEVKSKMENTWYIVPFTGNKIEAILDTSRTNLLTGEKENIRNYTDVKKIWFIIYE